MKNLFAFAAVALLCANTDTSSVLRPTKNTMR